MNLQRRLLLVLFIAVFPVAVAADDRVTKDRNGTSGTLILRDGDRTAPFDRSPRSVRSRAFDLKHARLELDLDFERQQILGRGEYRLAPFRAARRLVLDAREMNINRVERLNEKRVSQATLEFTERDGKLEIHLDKEAAGGEDVYLAIDYLVSQPRLGGHFVTPDKFEPDQPRMFWTQSEPEYAHWWFPCLDAPNERITSETIVTVPQSYFVLSNGVLEKKTPRDDGRQTWHWVQADSHVPYLVSVVAGEFDAYEQTWNGLPVVSYVPKGMGKLAKHSFEKTPAMMTYFSEKIGYRYPWPKYTHICVDEYPWGGMEHTSATTLTIRTLHDERAHLDYRSDNLVAHELAHQWWGDLITCKDWGEIWLNESFATYFATLWQEHDEGWDEATWRRHEEANDYKEEDAKKYRRPIVTYRYPRPGNMFDSHSYPKGARVLHMLRFELGDELFWKAINHYAHRHAHQVVETADLRTSIEQATGQSLNWFFDQWIYHGGHPEFEVSWTWDDAEQVARVDVKQKQEVNRLTPLFRTSVEIELVTGDKTATRRVTIDGREASFSFAMDRRPRRVLFDPRDWILKELEFQKSKQEWLDQLAHDENIMCRARAAKALAEHKRDADVLAALIAAARDDAYWGVRQQAAESVGKFVGEQARRALIAIATTDPKSKVRRAAIKALGEFAHAETSEALRTVLRSDRSYYAIADALRSLVEVDRENCRDELIAALEMPSHGEVILQAAAEGLAKQKEEEAIAPLLKLLEPPSPAERRVAVMASLAQLGRDDDRVHEALAEQLKDARLNVRRKAVQALEQTGSERAIELLLAQRAKEHDFRMSDTIDSALKKLRDGDDLDTLREQLQSLEEKNQKLEERLRTLEERKGSE